MFSLDEKLEELWICMKHQILEMILPFMSFLLGFDGGESLDVSIDVKS
jgi:hypothetical protein